MSKEVKIPNVNMGNGKIINFSVGVDGDTTFKVSSTDGEGNVVNEVTTESIIKALSTVGVVMIMQMINTGVKRIKEEDKENLDDIMVKEFAKNLITGEIMTFESLSNDIKSDSILTSLYNKYNNEENEYVKLYYATLVAILFPESISDMNSPSDGIEFDNMLN